MSRWLGSMQLSFMYALCKNKFEITNL
jgi:hypothetical protein